MADQTALRFIGLLFGAVTMAISTIALTVTLSAANQVQIATEISSSSPR